MDTPICDFARDHAASGALRLHMPGHKGRSILGPEPLDITEIDGVDDLYAPGGIIRESEENAGALFGCPTFYSTEGSSQCVRAMLYLALLHAKRQGLPPLIAAGRNAHKTFLSAAALLDLQVTWLYPEGDASYLSCPLTADTLDAFLRSAPEKPAAVYLTSPDYLGGMPDLGAMAAVCRAHGVWLLVDNAHGAYLRFLRPSQHPIDLGADLCCDSAHKTLPVLTGGAYLHVSPALTSPDYLGGMPDLGAMAAVCRAHGVWLLVDNAHGAYLRFLRPSQHPIDLGADLCCDSAHKTLPVLTGGAYLHVSPALLPQLRDQIRPALSLFGSTSPSYLILQSLDAANPYLAAHPQRLDDFLPLIWSLKARLVKQGWTLYGQEPLKITLQTKPYGYRGTELAVLLLKKNIVCEFSDPDYLVLMLTPETGPEGLTRLEEALRAIPRRPPVREAPPVFRRGKQVRSIREALLSPAVSLPTGQCGGRVLAAATVGCPPAVPILACGEEIDEAALAALRYYGIQRCLVLSD